jgi:hypothetical protein
MKKSVFTFVLLLQALWLDAQDITVNQGGSQTLNASQTVNNITITGGALTITSGAVITVTGNVVIAGTSTHTGSCLVKEPGSKLIIGYLNMSTFNTGLLVQNSGEVVIGSHTLSATAPNACNINVTTGGILRTNYGLNIGSRASVKFSNADAIVQNIGLSSAAIFEASGAQSDISATAISINGAAEVRILSSAKVNLTGDFNMGGSDPVLQMTAGGRLSATNFNANVGKIISSGTSTITLSGEFNNSLGLDLYPTGSNVNLVMDANASQQINGINRFGSLKIMGSSGSLVVNSNLELTNLLDLTGSRIINVNSSLTISNPSSLAVSRSGTAYLNVLHDQSRFIRATNSNAEYLFPVGTSTIYRPVYLKPSLSSIGSYSVRCAGYAPYNFTSCEGGLPCLGLSIIPVDLPNKKRINNLYHHEIRDQLSGDASPSASIYIGYDPVVDLSQYDGIAQHLNGAWQALQVPVSKPAEGNLLFAGVTPYEISSSNFAYVLVNSVASSVPPSYVSLKKKLDGGYYYPINNTIYFLFEEEYSTGASSLAYRVLDLRNNVQSGLTNLGIGQGVNKLQLNVGSLLAGYYVLEVSNAKSEKWYLRFKK